MGLTNSLKSKLEYFDWRRGGGQGYVLVIAMGRIMRRSINKNCCMNSWAKQQKPAGFISVVISHRHYPPRTLGIADLKVP